MTTRRINPVVDTFRGINNSLNPCSAQYRQFTAFDAQNSRINDSGIWDKAAALGDNDMGDASQVDLPEGSGDHFKEAFINSVQTIVGKLLPKDSIDVGPNKYAYFANPDLDSGQVKWWDGVGTEEDTSDETTSGDWGKAGLGRPSDNITAAISTISANAQLISIETVEDHNLSSGTKITISNTTNFNEADVTLTSASGTSLEYTSTKTFDSPDEETAGMVVWGIGVAANLDSKSGGRMERGTYYYMYTLFDTVREVESLPSNVTDWVADAWTVAADQNGVDSCIYPTVMISPDAGHSPSVGSWRYDTNTRIRVYRTKRTYEPERQIHAPNEFFYIGDLAYNAVAMSMDDFAHDSELVDRYEGRGTPPPTGVDYLVSFENRMYYFVGNVVHWSSAGRPEEVALEYTLTYETRDPEGLSSLSSTFPMMPIMASLAQGEAKYEISELAGQTVVAAYSYGGKLWVWTETMVGYLRPTMASEGVRFHLIRKGLGLVSSKTLAHTPYGLFGADREGVWLLDNGSTLVRLSKGRIDIDDSGKFTYFEQAELTNSFGVWVPALSEYWWCGVNSGEVYIQIAYQPLRKIWGGMSDYEITGGCTMITSAGAQCFLTQSGGNGQTPSATSVATDMDQVLDFWMGQHSLGSVKDQLKVEIIYESITATKTVTVDLYQNNIASIYLPDGETECPSDKGIAHSNSNLVGVAKGNNSGRMFLIRISTDGDTQAPIIAINYTANEVLWSEKHGR